MKKIIKQIIGNENYEILKKKRDQHLKRKNLKGKYTFISNKKNKEKVCLILAGYKPFLFDIIFKRIKRFIPEDIDVCIVSSGLYNDKLAKIAQENEWSYLYTKKNCVTLAQNLAIKEFPKAKFIYKLDEDIFLTERYFETMYKTWEECQKNGDYQIGFVAPTIPINGFGHLKILKRFNLVKYYSEHYERPIYAAGANRMVESNPEVAKFFWGEKDLLPSIDKMNEIVLNDEFEYTACPIKFSIGAIFFTRETWEDMGYFKVENTPCMGLDEEQFCNFCMAKSKAIIVSNNSVVGHLSFGKQNNVMKDYFYDNKDKFDIE